jgi:hypothetical protein
MAKITLTHEQLQKRTEQIGAANVHHSDYKSTGDSGDYDKRRVEVESFDTVIHEGRVQFTRDFEGWASKIHENPTVADGLRAMQTSMEETNDGHHVFFEGFGKAKKVEDGPCGHCGHTPEPGSVLVKIEIHTGS